MPNNLNTPYFIEAALLYTGWKRYECSNHLGNVLAVVSDRRVGIDSGSDNLADYFDPVLISAQDYYPFGAAMPDRSANALNTDYRFGFNGKEKDKSSEWGGLTHYDYGFRIYNPGIGRFLSVDPLAQSFPWNSPYSYAEGDVIRSIDLDGLEKYYVHGTGQVRGVWKGSEDFQDALQKNLGGVDKRYFAKWKGSNNSADREYGAELLVKMVTHTYVEGETITLIGHSHGGNVAIETEKMLREVKGFEDVDINLILLNTPARDDYIPTDGNHTWIYNFYVKDDVIAGDEGGYNKTGRIDHPSQLSWGDRISMEGELMEPGKPVPGFVPRTFLGNALGLEFVFKMKIWQKLSGETGEGGHLQPQTDQTRNIEISPNKNITQKKGPIRWLRLQLNAKANHRLWQGGQKQKLIDKVNKTRFGARTYNYPFP